MDLATNEPVKVWIVMVKDLNLEDPVTCWGPMLHEPSKEEILGILREDYADLDDEVFKDYVEDEVEHWVEERTLLA